MVGTCSTVASRPTLRQNQNWENALSANEVDPGRAVPAVDGSVVAAAQKAAGQQWSTTGDWPTQLSP